MRGRIIRGLVCASVIGLTGAWPVSAQLERPLGGMTALPGQTIRDSVQTKTVEPIEVTLWRAGDVTPISRFISAPCSCKYPLWHYLSIGALPAGLYQIHLRASDGEVTQDLSVTTFGTITSLDQSKVIVMAIDLRTGHLRHDVTLSLKDDKGEVAIPIGADGLGRTSVLVPGEKILIARGSDGSVVTQRVQLPGSDVRTYGYLDRKTYRPGDAVYYTAISRYEAPDERAPFLVSSSSAAVPAATQIYKSSCCLAYAFRIPSNTKPGYYWTFPAGELYVEPRTDTDGVDAIPLRSHYNIGDTAVFAVSGRPGTQLRYEIWLQNNAENDVSQWNPNVLLASGDVVPDKTGIARISAVLKRQALKVEARLYEPNSTLPVYVAFADIDSHFAQNDLSIPDRRLMGQPLPMIASGRPLSVVRLKIYGGRDDKKPLFESQKRTDANGYALFTWYPSANGQYRAEASQASWKYPVNRSFTVGPGASLFPQVSSVDPVAMPQTPSVAPGQNSAYLVFAPQKSDALVRWSSGSDLNVNVQRVGPVSRVVIPSSRTSDMVNVEIHGVANLEPWTIYTSFLTNPQPHRLRVKLLTFQHGVRIRVTDYRNNPVAARVIVTVRRASGAALLEQFDDDSAYDALYRGAQVIGHVESSWWSPGYADGSLATPSPAPTPDPSKRIPTLPPETAPTTQPQSETLYFNPFVETDASGTAEITFPWSSSDAPPSAIIRVLAITADLRIGQAHSNVVH